MMVRLKRKTLLIAAVLLVLAAGAANAALIQVYGNLTPINAGHKLYVPPGTTKTVYMNATTDVITTTATGVNKLQYDVVNGSAYYSASLGSKIYIWNNTTSSWQYYTTASPTIINSTSGYITWTGPAGSYNVSLNVTSSPTTPSTATGEINLTFSSYNATFTTGNLYYNISTYSFIITPTPELLTLGLVGVGAAAVILLRRRMF